MWQGREWHCVHTGTRGNYWVKQIQGMRGPVASWGRREQLGDGLVPIHGTVVVCVMECACGLEYYNLQRKSSSSSNWCRK